MPINSNLAGVARVAFEAVTGDFNADVARAEARYKDATSGMSDSALRLELAQDKLRRALAKGPAASREQARALLQVRQAERELEGQTRQTTAEIDRQQRELARGTRGFSALRSNVVGLASAFVGTTGLIYGLRSTITAAQEAQTTQGRLAVAVRNAGLEYGRYRTQIDRTIQATATLAALDDEELADSFAKLVIRTRDVNEALRLTGLAADVARGRQISLVAATQLVIKASLGQAGQLGRVGIEVGKNATAQELLSKLTQAYAGQAERYASSAVGAQDRLRVSFEESQEVIGRGLLPTVNNLASGLADYLDKANRTGQLQRDVNEAVRTGGQVVRGLAGAFRVVKSATEPVVAALGGVENTVKALGLLWAGLKVKAALGFAGTALASRTTSTRMIADATAAGLAWDRATRTRAMTVIGGGGALGRGGPTPTTARGGGGSRMTGLGLLGGPIGLGIEAAAVSALYNRGQRAATRRKVQDAWNQMDAGEQRLAVQEARGPWRAYYELFDLRFKPLPRTSFRFGLGGLTRRLGGPDGSTTRTTGAPQFGDPGWAPLPDRGETTTPTTQPSRGPTRLQTLGLQMSESQRNDDLAAQRRIQRRIVAIYQARVENTRLTGQALVRFKQELSSQLDVLDGIEDSIDAEQQQRSERAAEKRRQRREAAEAKAKRRRDAEKRAAERASREREADARKVRARLTSGPYANTSADFASGGVAASVAKRPGEDREKKERALTLADFRRFSVEFLAGLQGVTNQFGGNLGGETATNIWRTSKLMEEQNGLLRGLASGVRHPGAKYTRSEMMQNYGGVGGI